MTPDERQRMTALCELIATEKDHDQFMKLVQELNDLLEGKGHRLESGPAAGKPKTP